MRLYLVSDITQWVDWAGSVTEISYNVTAVLPAVIGNTIAASRQFSNMV